jgi:UDP-2,3-diacylglucosamine hydrolase
LIPAGQIVVIGDSHIGLSEGSEKAINEWLDRLVACSPRALYLNGDLFHYLIAHRSFRTTSVDKVMEKFRDVIAHGIAVHYVEGNRDFFIKGSFVEDSVTDIEDEYLVAAGSNKYLITHGDAINDRDYAYRFWRRFSKNRMMRFAVNFIPRRVARGFVDSVEARLSRSNFKHKMQLPLALMQEFGKKHLRHGVTHIVLGHFHEKVVLPGKPTVTVLPPWYETGEAMVIDPASGAFSFEVI